MRFFGTASKNFFCLKNTKIKIIFPSESQLVKSTISYQMVGVIIGSMVFGYLSDSYGRKKIMLIALICCILCMVATSFTNGFFLILKNFKKNFFLIDLISFTIVRFFVNFFNAGTMVILVVFTSEHYPNSHRFCLSNLITWYFLKNFFEGIFWPKRVLDLF